MTKDDVLATYNEPERDLKPFIDVCRIIIQHDIKHYSKERSLLHEMLSKEKSGDAYWGIIYNEKGELI